MLAGWRPACMARAYSNDLRSRVVRFVVGGHSCRETAAIFGVSVASVVKWSQRFRATGSAAAKPMGGRHRPLCLGGRARLAVVAHCRDAGRHLARAAGGASRARHRGELLRGLAFLRARGDQLQKKACAPASRIGRTSPAGAPDGSCIRASLMRLASCSSTRPGRRPT